MIALFKTDCSIGRSILTLGAPENTTEESADSIFSIAEEFGLSRLVLVEDSLIGFLEAFKKSKQYGIDLIFGLRLEICNVVENEKMPRHKIIIFARNDNGCKILNRIYSLAYAEGDGCLSMESVADYWKESDLKLAIPFYDSFIFNNIMTFNSCTPDFSFTKPIFFYENNDLPFDAHLYHLVKQYCEANNFTMEEAKSIYYRERSDFDAYQAYKIICGRGGFGRQRTLEVPNLNHMGSKEFSFQSYLERLSQ